MKIRPATPFMSLGQSMKHVREIGSRAELIAFLDEEWLRGGPVTDENVTCIKWGDGIDERIGWDTHLICVDGKAALFSDGPLP